MVQFQVVTIVPDFSGAFGKIFNRWLQPIVLLLSSYYKEQ